MKIFTKIGIQLNNLSKSVFDYFTNTYKADQKDFSIANAWGQVLNAMEEMARLNLFYIEDSVTELNSVTALRHDSIRGLSTLTGHKPYLGKAAEGVLMLYTKPNGQPLNVQNVVIPNYSLLYNRANGLEYSIVLDSDYIIIPNIFQGSADLKVVQGVMEEQIDTGTGEKLQTFHFDIDKNYYIDNDRINVFINGSKWERVNSLLEMSFNSETYYITAGITGGIDVYFGNELSGKIPELGAEVKIQYIKHSGELGNIIGDVDFEFSTPLYDTTGEEAQFFNTFGLSVKNKLLFGSNPEDINLTKRLFNRIDKSNVLYTTSSFEVFFQKFNMFSTVKAFQKIGDNILQDDNIVYLMLVPDFQKRISKQLNYFNIPEEYFKMTANEKARISKMIDESGRKPSQIQLNIVDPILKRYVINIKVVIFPEFQMQKELVRENIRIAIANYFIQNKRYDRIPKSDLVYILETVPGIDSVFIHILSEDNEKYKINNPNSNTLIGLDSFNDIILNNNEYAILRGGWTDSNGITYSNNINDPYSMLNITIQ